MIIATLIAGFISLVIGVLDDKFDLSPYVRFLVNIFCAVIVVFMGANIPFITNPFGGILFLNHLHLPFLQGRVAVFLRFNCDSLDSLGNEHVELE